MSLAEMLVSIVLFAIVAGSIGAVVVTSLRHQVDVQNRADALAAARTVLDRVDHDIRSAGLDGNVPQVQVPDPQHMTITETPDASGAARVVSYAVTGSTLTQSVNGGSPRVIARYLVNTATPVFTYDTTTYVATVTFSQQPPKLNTPITVTDRNADGTGGAAVRNVPTPIQT